MVKGILSSTRSDNEVIERHKSEYLSEHCIDALARALAQVKTWDHLSQIEGATIPQHIVIPSRSSLVIFRFLLSPSISCRRRRWMPLSDATSPMVHVELLSSTALL
jgi:hypothetical protein